MVSSLLTSLDDLLEPLSLLSPGSGGGEELFPDFPGGVTDRPDFRELREALREGVRYGVDMGVGNEPTGSVDSSSVSHMAMLTSVWGIYRFLQSPERVFMTLQ